MTGPVVLIAEDDPSVRLTLEFVLEDEGYVVLMAEDGEKALQLARAHVPDVILLDQIMPKLDGKMVYAALIEDSKTASIPVLVLSGMSRTNPDDWKGAHFLGKPFSPDELVARIRSVLSV
jgi:DNA-binding response OmpR family regulator